MVVSLRCFAAQSHSTFRWGYCVSLRMRGFSRFIGTTSRAYFYDFVRLDFKFNESLIRGKKMVGMRGFEPPTSRPPVERANRTALHPDRCHK